MKSLLPTRTAVRFYCMVIILLISKAAFGQSGYYFSVGDNQSLGQHMSLDSEESIAATFDMLQTVYGVERIYWRGLQMQQIANSLIRPESADFAYHLDWQAKTLSTDRQINHIATQLAHERGMQIWGEGALYDWGTNAIDTVSRLGWPGPDESYFRLNNPQWVPVDRFGLRRQSGPIELGYAEARMALSNWLAQTARDTGYDGVLLHTFAENYSVHHQDEFGFNDPVASDFQGRYGVDIRREDFNREDWRQLRGEYTTQFLTSLKDQLGSNGISLGVTLSGHSPSQAMTWAGSPFPTAGSMTQEWQKWINTGIVDELQIREGLTNGANTNTIVQQANAGAVGVSSVVQNPFDPSLDGLKSAGVTIVGAALTLEEFMRNSPIPLQPVESLNHTDPYKRMRVLGQIIDGTTNATVDQVRLLLNDSNLLVRRMAIQAIAKTGDPQAIPLLEDAMFDESNTIRTAAVYALQNLHDSGTPQRILDAMAQNGNPTFLELAKNTLVEFGAQNMELLLTNAIRNHPNVDVRRLAARTLWSFGAAGPHTARMLQAINIGMTDSDPYVRFYAAAHAAHISPDDNSIGKLMDAARSTDSVVAIRAADSLGELFHYGFSSIQPHRQSMLDTLSGQFVRYGGSAAAGSNTDWGYEPVGRAMLQAGDDGKAKLREFMTQRQDRLLSENAWRVLFTPHDRTTFSVMTEHEAEQAYLRRPRWDSVTAMSDSFSAALSGQTLASYTPETGTRWRVLYGDPNEQTIVTRDGNEVLRLHREYQSEDSHAVGMSGHMYDAAVAEITQVTVKASWLREDANTHGGLELDLGHTDVNNPSVILHSTGTYWVTTPTGTIDTGFSMNVGGWDTLELVLTWGIAEGDFVNGTYDVFLSRPGDDTFSLLDRRIIAHDVPVGFTSLASLQQLIIYNDANAFGDAVTYWDDILVRVDPILVPEPAGIPLFLGILTQLIRRRRAG